jgi:formamidopyrimidine-DNA glycosylase
MPELPEVEVVRRGMDRWAVGRTIESVEVLNTRAIRNHIGDARDFATALAGRTFTAASRRGKFMWLVLDSGDALMTHLGMSGQVLMQPGDADDEKHLRIRCRFADGDRQMRFVDQRTFGGMAVEPRVDGGSGELVPRSAAHIARDPFDPHFDRARFIARIRAKSTQLKRALLDQELVSGIGNIYADEALWRSKLHWAMPTGDLTARQAGRVLDHATDVMAEALEQGGTSFDSLYVNVNGESGYFSRSLHAYGREDEPCDRCRTLIVREAFANRSSFRCPKCQPL